MTDLSQLVQRLNEDEAFRTVFTADPVGVLDDEGILIAPGNIAHLLELVQQFQPSLEVASLNVLMNNIHPGDDDDDDGGPPPDDDDDDDNGDDDDDD